MITKSKTGYYSAYERGFVAEGESPKEAKDELLTLLEQRGVLEDLARSRARSDWNNWQEFNCTYLEGTKQYKAYMDEKDLIMIREMCGE